MFGGDNHSGDPASLYQRMSQEVMDSYDEFLELELEDADSLIGHEAGEGHHSTLDRRLYFR